jgi:hypothetical protein
MTGDEALERWLETNPPPAGAGYAACWKAACAWQLADADDRCELSYKLELDLLKEIGELLEPVEYLGSYAEGVRVLQRQLAESQARVVELEKQLASSLRNKWKQKCLDAQAELAALKAGQGEASGHFVKYPYKEYKV